MALQTQIHKNLARGMKGEFVDNSPRRVRAFAVFGKTEAKATGTLTATGNFSENDTVTVGVQTYKFVKSLTNAYDVKLGADLATSLSNLEKAINGTGTEGTKYASGTLKNVLASAVATSTTLEVTAIVAGVVGNTIATTETGSACSFGGTILAGGADLAEAQIARAFTYSDVENKAVIGGSGVFAGIAVNPKEYAIYNNFNSSMVLPNGVAGQLCTFGRFFVEVTNDISIGQSAFYNIIDGSIKGGTAGSSIAGHIEIPNSMFTDVPAQAGEIAVLQLGK